MYAIRSYYEAKNIRQCCAEIVERHDGRVPGTMHELVGLPGVGRKTANVVLGSAFGEAEGVVVDTHVKRISGLLGLTTHTDPEKIERDLMELRITSYNVCYTKLLRVTLHLREPQLDLVEPR